MWRRKHHPDPDLEDAKRRLEEAQRDLEAARRDDGKVDDLAERMHEIRRQNRFAALMKQALRGNQ